MLTPTTPESEFVFSLVRRIGNPDQAETRMREIAQNNPDWKEIIALSAGHGITPLLSDAITNIIQVVPEEVAQKIQKQCRERTIENLRYVDRLHDLNEIFQKNNVRVFPYKGPVVAQIAYGSIGGRRFSDLDFLVVEEDILDVCDILHQRGYKQTEFVGISPSKLVEGSVFRWEGEFHFTNEEDGIPIDIRYQFVGKYRDTEGLFSDLWERRTSVSLGGKSIPALSAEDRIMLLLAHGTKHGWSRLSWACDVSLFLQEDVDWDVVVNRATQYGWKTAALLGIAVVAELAEIEVPNNIRQQIAEDPRANYGSSILCTLFLTDPTGERLDLDPLTIILLLNNTPIDALREAFDKTVSPWPIDYQYVSLPQRLYPLYYIIRPLRILLDRIR